MNEDSTVAVAVGQIRSGRLRYQRWAVSWEVLEMGERSATIREVGHESLAGITIEDLSRWPCVGIVTPHGRVMVGERRLGDDGRAYDVTGVLASEYVSLRGETPRYDGGNKAERVARWAQGAFVALAQTDAYQQAVEDCSRAIAITICGPSADPREQGPGLAALPSMRREVRPDVVVCERWEERWGGP